jgi:hypothetical protein
LSNQQEKESSNTIDKEVNTNLTHNIKQAKRILLKENVNLLNHKIKFEDLLKENDE